MPAFVVASMLVAGRGVMVLVVVTPAFGVVIRRARGGEEVLLKAYQVAGSPGRAQVARGRGDPNTAKQKEGRDRADKNEATLQPLHGSEYYAPWNRAVK